MAGTTIGTNIVADENALSDLAKAILEDIRRLLDYKVSTKKERLLKELYNRISSGEQCVLKFVPQQFVERIERALQDQNIPYHTVYGQNGDVAFLVTERDRNKLMDIQKEIFMTNTAYFAEAKASAVLNTSKKYSVEKGPVVRLSFKEGNREGFEFAKQQLFNNKIVSGVLDFENVSKNRDGQEMEAEIYISSDDYFNDRGQDISKIELEYALHQTINGIEKNESFKSDFAKDIGAYFKRKENKLKYDNEQMKEFAKQIKAGNKAVLGDVTNGSEFYLQTEHGQLQMVSKANGMWTPHNLDNCRGADLQSIISVISSYSEHISNMHVYANVQEHDDKGIYRYDNWNPDIEMTADEKIEAIKNSGRLKEVTKSGELRDIGDELTQEEVADIKENVRKKYRDKLKNAESNEEKDKIKKIIEKEINEEITDEIKNKPTKIMKQDDIVKAELEKITEVTHKISKDASQYVELNLKSIPISKKYEEREKLVKRDLNNPNNEYIRFYLEGGMDKAGEPHLRQEERKEILSEVLYHYETKNEHGQNEMIVEHVINDKNLMNEVLEDEYNIEHVKVKSKEDDKDKKRDKEREEEDKQKTEKKDENTSSDTKSDVDTQDESERGRA